MRAAVLGTGTTGAPIAANLVGAGHDVIVWNRTRAKAEAVEGATVADTPTEATRGAEVLLTMLTYGLNVVTITGNSLKIVLDSRGILDRMTLQFHRVRATGPVVRGGWKIL